jgi:hypothetical protein
MSSSLWPRALKLLSDHVDVLGEELPGGLLFVQDLPSGRFGDVILPFAGVLFPEGRVGWRVFRTEWPRVISGEIPLLDEHTVHEELARAGGQAPEPTVSVPVRVFTSSRSFVA